MRKLYWLILSMISAAHNDEYNRLGEGEYLASHGVANEIEKPDIRMIEGEAVIKLQKHLNIK